MKMFPDYYYAPKGSRSFAEKQVFKVLKDLNLHGWAFHSLNLKHSVNDFKPSAEADFVILTENGLLVVEVKGGKIERTQRGWRYVNRHGASDWDKLGPFEQSEQAMRSLVEILEVDHGKELLKKCNYFWAVAFPNTKFDQSSAEWKDLQILDERHLKNPNSSDLCPQKVKNWLEDIFKEMRKTLPNKTPMTSEQIQRIRDAIRGDIVTFVSLNSLNAETKESQVRMTNLQIEFMDGLAKNDRVVVEGGAGTGKTILAQHAAAYFQQNGLVLLICPNKALVNHLEEDEELLWPGSTTVTTVDEIPSDTKYDCIIIDEAQDIMDQEIIDILEEHLNGGADSGKWRIFLDSNNQAKIMNRFDSDIYKELCKKASLHRLSMNCRNTNEITDWVKRLCAADIGNTTWTKGQQPELHFFNREESVKRLEEELDELVNSGIQYGKITIISPTPEASIVNELPDRFDRKIYRFDPNSDTPNKNLIKFTTPEGFKGLENDYIFYVDAGDFTQSSEETSELYVAITRASIAFQAFFFQDAKDEINKRIVENSMTRVTQ